MKKSLSLLLALLLLLATAGTAFAEQSGANPAEDVWEPQAIKLNKYSATLYVGQATTFSAKIYSDIAANNIIYKYKTVFLSTDTDVFTVSKLGVVTAKGVGTANLIAYVNGYQSIYATATVTVESIPQPQRVMLKNGSKKLAEGDTITLNVGASATVKSFVYPKNASQTVRWTIGNTGVATVKNGKVTAVAPGKTMLACYPYGRRDLATYIYIKVERQVAKLYISLPSKNFTVGDVKQVSCNFRPGNAVPRDFLFYTSDENVIEMYTNADGTKLYAKAVGAGTCYIRLYSSDAAGVKSNTIKITVKAKVA